MIERLQDAQDRTLRIEDPDDDTRAYYRQAISAVANNRLAPPSLVLRYTGRDTGDLIIRLTDRSDEAETDWNRIRLSAREWITDPCATTTVLATDPDALDVSDVTRRRAVRFVEELSREARRNGYRLAISRNGSPRQLSLLIRDHSLALEMHDNNQNSYGGLLIEIPGRSEEPRRWADDHDSRVEDDLPEMFEEFCQLAEAADARQRALDAQFAEWDRQEAEERAEWERVIRSAYRQARRQHRQSIFIEALSSWITAADLRGFCTHPEEAARDHSDTKQQTALRRWENWGRTWADRIDPLRNLDRLSKGEFDLEPEPEDLRPYIGDWSPHEPERFYTWDRDVPEASSPTSTQTEYRSGRWFQGGAFRAPPWIRDRGY